MYVMLAFKWQLMGKTVKVRLFGSYCVLVITVARGYSYQWKKKKDLCWGGREGTRNQISKYLLLYLGGQVNCLLQPVLEPWLGNLQWDVCPAGEIAHTTIAKCSFFDGSGTFQTGAQVTCCLILLCV